ncbi:Spectrin beta chain, non-erythrocytic 4 [Irineochytrium annulatum]|nr:Spectrin beta chain, non-erythrocytic 4 [Irineochytrium annulatum]
MRARHLAVQQKVFMKWVNSRLSQHPDGSTVYRVTNLNTDLQDGVLLLKLLESLSGQSLPKPDEFGGRTHRIHKISNVEKSIHWLEGRVGHAIGIAPELVVDGNVKIIMGLVWTVISTFSMGTGVQAPVKQAIREQVLLLTVHHQAKQA